MIATNIKKPGRNKPCPCGSGHKYKKCCGKLGNFPHIPKLKPFVAGSCDKPKADLTLRDMLKCLYLLLEGASEANIAIPKGPIPFSKKMIKDVPDDLVSEILVAEKDGFLILTVKKKNEPLIKMPRLIV